MPVRRTAALGDAVSPTAPTVADVERIAALIDPVLRNLQITQCYCELSRALAARTDGEPANWCTFATWASKQAGQTIRKEDLARAFERLFAQSPRATSTSSAAVGSIAELEPAHVTRSRSGMPYGRRSSRLPRSTARATPSLAATSRSSRRSAASSRACCRCQRAGGAIDPKEFESFRDSLRPGDPPDGQGYLRQAFTSYAEALRERDPKARAELMLLANLAIGLHEQTRLQPQITEALDAPFEEPVELRRDLLRSLLSLQIGLAFRLLLELIPGRATSLKSVLDDLDRLVKQIAHEAITERADDPQPAGRGVEPRPRRAGHVPRRPRDDRQPRSALASRPRSTRRPTRRAAAARTTGRSSRNGSTSSPICFASTRSARPC